MGIKDGIDTSTVTGKMIANIMGAVAEVELENIHEQTLAGRQQKPETVSGMERRPRLDIL